MISKRKRNTILAYCMATVVMLCVLASNVFKVTTSLKTNTKKLVAGNNYVETSEISYGLVAIEASSCIEDKDTQNVTEQKEEKKEESEKESAKANEDKKESSKSNETKAAKSNSNKTKSNKTTTKKKSNTTVKKSNTKKKKTTKKSNTTATKKTTNEEDVVTTSSNSSLGVQIVNYAKQFNGNPYVYGGTSLTKGADCSGFVQSVYKHFGIKLPRGATSQSRVGKKVAWNALQPGDLIFYGHGSHTKIAHVAIYIGNGKIIHAQTPRDGIGITTYNIMTKVTARRVI